MTKNQIKKQHIQETIVAIQRKIETLKLQLAVQQDNLDRIEAKIAKEKNSND